MLHCYSCTKWNYTYRTKRCYRQGPFWIHDKWNWHFGRIHASRFDNNIFRIYAYSLTTNLQLDDCLYPFINIVSYNSKRLFSNLMESFRRDIYMDKKNYWIKNNEIIYNKLGSNHDSLIIFLMHYIDYILHMFCYI